MSATESDRTLAARIAAHESWAKSANRSARTAPARAALLAKFEAQVDPDGSLSPEERLSRAENARKAHFTRLALKSARSRRKAADLTVDPDRADAELAEAGGPDAS